MLKSELFLLAFSYEAKKGRGGGSQRKRGQLKMWERERGPESPWKRALIINNRGREPRQGRNPGGVETQRGVAAGMPRRAAKTPVGWQPCETTRDVEWCWKHWASSCP